jgi:hypothetical protein
VGRRRDHGDNDQNVASTGGTSSPVGDAIGGATYWWASAGKFSTLVYDADLDCWIKLGGDGAIYGMWLQNGVPPELMVQLCAAVGAHPWFAPPQYACDPVTDWITGLATYCRDNGPSWMVPRFEAEPNECWNFRSGFNATRYAWNKSAAHWGTDQEQDDWVGKVASLQGQAISAVYSNDRTRYQCIVGVMTYGPSAPNVRHNSTRYVVDGGSGLRTGPTHLLR